MKLLSARQSSPLGTEVTLIARLFGDIGVRTSIIITEARWQAEGIPNYDIKATYSTVSQRRSIGFYAVCGICRRQATSP
jgi:hypothetical protein